MAQTSLFLTHSSSSPSAGGGGSGGRGCCPWFGGMDHGGHVGHQECAGDPRKHAQQGEVQANSGSRSPTLSPTRSQGNTHH
jgi:hypothetical protein